MSQHISTLKQEVVLKRKEAVKKRRWGKTGKRLSRLASAFVSHLNTTRVMRFLNELHTDSGMNTLTDPQTQRVLFRQRGQSGDVVGLVTPIRERVTVGETGAK